ncbi:MAG: DnaJ domain [Pedosphaera sp.]|nr:DnaJ domain [Pedosphaera sp.]
MPEGIHPLALTHRPKRRMPTDPPYSQRAATAWSGERMLVEKWLARRCAVESLAHLAGGVVFLIIGLVAFVITSCATAALVSFILIEGNALLSVFGLGLSLFRPVMFAILFLFFLALSIMHAYKTRWGTDSAMNLDVGTAFSTASSLGWEFLSAGPILLVLSGQDFHRYLRLSRLDVPHVSALLVWLYDKGHRAGFAEISLAFPGLNVVRVLPQLRDLPGIHWWPDQGEISLTEDLRQTFAEILRRKPKDSPFFNSSTYQRPHFKKPAPEIDQTILLWYATLNLPLFANLQEVKARYRKLAKIHHPDAQSARRRAGETPNDEQMKRINEAYHNILKHSQNQPGTHPENGARERT